MAVSSSDLQMLVDTARDWASENAAARAGLHRDPALGSKQWQEVAQMGWAAAAVPQAQGGADFGFVGLGALLTAIGRELADIPLLSTGIAAAAIARFGSDGQRDALLPALVGGETLAALALGEGAHHGALTAKAEKTGDGYALTGRKSWVHAGGTADLFLVSAQADVPALFLVEGTAVTREAVDSVDGRAFAHIVLDGVTVPEDARLSGDAASVDWVLALARAGLAAEMVGACERAIEITVDYLQTREQFGKKIGTFQALQHRAAQMHVDLELARSCVEAALVAADEESDQLVELAVLAKYMAGEAIHLASNEMVQMHGGIGMTAEHVAGNYLKYARVSETLLGGSALLAQSYATLKGY